MKTRLVGIALGLGIALIVVAIVLCSMSFPEYVNRENMHSMIEFESGVYWNKNWYEESVLNYTGEAVPDKETAVKIAQVIFDGMSTSEYAEEYNPQYVFYDAQDEIWIVSFWDDSDATVLGGNCNIAMQKKDGKVLRIWFGE